MMEVKRQRSTSRSRQASRPTTPLRSSSRTSIRDTHSFSVSGGPASGSRPGINSLEPQFAELADSMADLEENFVHLQLMHESLSRFNESFASFLYGLNMNAFCVDFPETPIPESFTRFKQREKAREKENELQAASNQQYQSGANDAETTFMTTDTSFVDNPPTTTKSSVRYTTPGPASKKAPTTSTRGSSTGRYSTRGSSTTSRRGTRLARPRGRDIR
ncbi:hypothetical protein H112_08605 [Trichophyton rubrum D6]|uniref:DASH complex subunit DAM1 n=2 Tax=Trichophyton TaxID=5550 RepID=A0A022VPE7_TRIRU|nr:hypothetical protein H100_08627 [Trichophyton rubrum MR850]EZF36992.1 hypothetical protein H102_08586 [Trichophyton rubrum CBS 100081]EZF47608.1 hypothetical protein H103_08609 [Trichophyton rubrum CBS 288.86]EZF58284.1 hypothetical protein H104_08561 [Trichophyton rubrum CBS 289.86]EZF68830.1 hypothetical protein H105_08614 [Trichophyton soudanense CBS 452.61]EZF79506.1 hypothetical protein H110_08611 [Trichophyton rubrum MR1448]EZF90034.1 hypothetical protein H113_08678 [Trichophyton rub